MKNYILLFLIVLLASPIIKAQKVNSITIERLEQRFALGKDTTYIVNFWATWCAPCVKEMPYFEKLQVQHQQQPLKVIFLSLDFKSQLESRVKPLVEKMKFKSEVYLADKKNEQEFIEKISKDWEGAIPATLIVNQNKSIRKFYQQEFTFDELEKTYQSLK